MNNAFVNALQTRSFDYAVEQPVQNVVVWLCIVDVFATRTIEVASPILSVSTFVIQEVEKCSHIQAQKMGKVQEVCKAI